jgi:rare lipoprotein A
MKRVLAGAAFALLSALAAGPASADGWSDGFTDSHAYSRLGNTAERDRNGRGTYAGRSNLGAMTSSSDDEDRPRANGRRSSRTGSYARTEGRQGERSRSSARAAGTYSGGGSSGMASYYWQPQRVASGGWFNPSAMTAAHKTLPFGTKVRVTNVNNGRSAVVTINDRGPFVAGRVIDLSRAAAGAVGMIASGLARVRMEVLGR